MDIIIRISADELRERGLMDAYRKVFNLGEYIPVAGIVTLTEAQAKKIGLEIGEVKTLPPLTVTEDPAIVVKAAAAPKRRTRKPKE